MEWNLDRIKFNIDPLLF